MAAVGFPELIIIVLLFAIGLFPWAMIFRKAGYSGWLSVLILVPGVNLILLFWFALANWPILRRAGTPGDRTPVA